MARIRRTRRSQQFPFHWHRSMAEVAETAVLQARPHGVRLPRHQQSRLGHLLRRRRMAEGYPG